MLSSNKKNKGGKGFFQPNLCLEKGMIVNMVIDTSKEKLRINKLVATKKEILFIEGDMIVPDSKPDILNTISTSGVVCIYKKEILEDKIRIDGNINTFIMYLPDDTEDKVRGLQTSLDFSETVQIPNCREGMNSQVETKLKMMECRVINGRKIGIKASLEIEIKLYSEEEIEIVNEIQNAEGIQMRRENLNVNSLVGSGETKIYAKDTISINNIDSIAEILKSTVCVCDKDIKISYNKILTKAEAEVKIMYLTEDNRINTVVAKIPVVGFIDIQNVTEENICDVSYEIRNILFKLNPVEEHSIYVEIEFGVMATVYEERKINLIQDMYSPTENLEFNKKMINTMTGKIIRKETKQIREKIILEGLGNKNIIDVDIAPNVEKETKLSNRIIYEGNVQLNFILSNDALQVENKIEKIPFEYSIENLENAENINTNMTIEIANQDFVVQDGNAVNANIDMMMNFNAYRNTNMNVMDNIQTNGEREVEDYSIIMYTVKRGDTLWEIAKAFGSTIEDIVRVNGIEDENKIDIGQKIFIPHYTKIPVNSYA